MARITEFSDFPEPPRDQVVRHTTRGGAGAVARLLIANKKHRAKRVKRAKTRNR